MPAAKPMAKGPVRRVARGASEMRVNFALGSAQLLPSSRDEIEAFVTALQSPALSSKRFRVEGHTDASGARDVNERLSQERAEAVATLLKSKGIDSGRIEAKGYGPDKPLPGVAKTSPQNRRVELVPITNG
jgi:outer membrane protein OmpA-like peptidoglycan-associated protein